MTSPKSELSVEYIHDVYSMHPKKPEASKKPKAKRAAPKKKVAKAAAEKDNAELG